MVVSGDRPTAMAAGFVLTGVGIAAIVGTDGTPAWCLARLVVVAALAAGALVALRRLGRVGRARLATSVAFVALPAGATIAYSYLTTSGLTAKGLEGLATAAGAALLLIAGARSLLRGRHGWRRLSAIPATLALLVLLCYPIAVAVYATNVPRSDLGRQTPADLGLVYRDVVFTTTDGVTLSGWYVPSTNGAAVIVLHGASSTRSSVLDQAATIARHGYGVLVFDARGHGRSAGRAMDFGWYGDRDVEAAVTYLAAQPDVGDAKIGAVGFSMGGEEAVGAMAAVPALRAVIAEGATNRTVEDKQFLTEEYGVRGWLTQQVDRMVYGLADLLTEASPPISLHDAVRLAAPRHVLLITAGDVPDEALAARYIKSASPDTVETWDVGGAAHTGGLRARPADWEQHVTAFLDAQLRA